MTASRAIDRAILLSGRTFSPRDLNPVLWLSADSVITTVAPYTLTGTVAQAVNTLTGIGTAFLGEVAIGDVITGSGGLNGTVTAIASNTSLTLSSSATVGAGVTATTNPQAGVTDRVSQWTDLSGLGNHATQGTASKRPLRTATAGPGGIASIKLDAVDDFLACAGLTAANVPTTGDVMMAVVFQLAGTGSQAIIYLGNGSALTPNFHFVGIQYVGGVGLVFNSYDGSEHRAVSNSGLSAGTPYVAVGVRESNVNKVYLNGVLQTTQVASGTPNVNVAATLALGSDAGLSNFTGAYLGAAAVAASAANAGQVVQLSRYLGRPHGVAVA